MNFLTASLAASALSMVDSVEAQSAAPEFYDFRRYQLASGPGTKLTESFFASALIPAATVNNVASSEV